MSSRLFGALLVVGLVAPSCGDGRLSAEEYFAEVSAASARYDQATDEIFDLYSTAVEDALLDFGVVTAGSDTATLVEAVDRLLNTTISEVTSAFEQVALVLETFIMSLANLEPPQQVESAHDAVTAALSRSRDAIPELVAALRGAEKLADISSTINGSSFGDTQPRVIAACLELEGVASDLGVAADLHCDEPDDPDSSQ